MVIQVLSLRNNFLGNFDKIFSAGPNSSVLYFFVTLGKTAYSPISA